MTQEATVSNSAALALFLERTRQLLNNIETWGKQLNLQIVQGEKTINEERHGSYQAPMLTLTNKQGQCLATVEPFGEALLGAHGRVDIIGKYGKQEKISYLSAGGPTITTRIQVGEGSIAEERIQKLLRGVEAEGWYWISPFPLRRAYPLSQEVFVDLFSAVSGHEF